MNPMTRQVAYDYIVMGSGAAGLLFALKVAHSGRVAIVTKKNMEESNSYYAQGGVAAVFSDSDSLETHVQDTCTAGAGLCHMDAVQATVSEGPQRIRDLQDYGVEFSMLEEDPTMLDLGREGGHSKRRVLHVKDFTGKAIIEVLLERVKEHENIEILEGHMAVDLIMSNKLLGTRTPGSCLGVYVLNEETGAIIPMRAPVTVLATGGAGKVYLYTSNPDVASGDGIAIAYRAGARVANMEFFQFHPTCLFHPRAKSFLISEALRGEGGELVLRDGTPFMKKYHELGSLAPRDYTARAIDTELKRTGDDYVLLDMSARKPDFIRNRFPKIYHQCLSLGIDMTAGPIPVVPAAHYSCGGVLTDLHGRTSIDGLYAIGEVAHTGLHGANRLASNSLLEALVFGQRAATACMQDRTRTVMVEEVPRWDIGKAVDSDEAVVITQTWDEIRRFMWNYVGIVRTDKRLRRALQRILLVREEIEAYYWNFIISRDLLELRNLGLVAELIIRSAMQRKESRGLHFNADFPEHNDILFGRDTIL